MCQHCERRAVARGLCGKHYQRWNVYGDALRERPTERERFTRLYRPDTSSGCWLWAGTKLPQGYGLFRTGSIRDGTRRYERAHRASWRLHRGEIPESLQVCHACDTPSCVNPDHLFLGTARENTLDMVRKGRHKPATHWPQMRRRSDGTWKPLAERSNIANP